MVGDLRKTVPVLALAATPESVQPCAGHFATEQFERIPAARNRMVIEEAKQDTPEP